MNKLLLGATILASCLLSACKETRDPISQDNLYEQFSSGVVLVHIRYTYVMEMETGDKFYFSAFDEEGNLDFTLDANKSPYREGTGTGFFISSDGQIATNSHVAYPDIDEKKVLAYLHGATGNFKNKVNEDIAEISDYMNTLRSAIQQSSEATERDELKKKLKDAEKAREKIRRLSNALEHLSHADGTLTCQVQIGIAYNNTFCDSYSDLIPCTQIRHSKENDVAIIQLKSKQTPDKCHIFDVEKPTKADGSPMPDEKGKPMDIDNLSAGTDVYLIGFNKGFAISSTKEGIKAQLLSGNVSQLVDDKEIMYTIPTLGGSSGSPVINKYGDLVAINYASWTDTQGFNYGISAKHLRNLFHQTDNN